MDNESIETKVEVARAGERDAVGWLVKKHQGLVFGICYRLTGSVHDAEDLAHEEPNAMERLVLLQEAKDLYWFEKIIDHFDRMVTTLSDHDGDGVLSKAMTGTRFLRMAALSNTGHRSREHPSTTG